MKPSSFHGQNVVFAEHQSEYQPLPAHRALEGRCTFCWRLSFKERIKVLFGGAVWHEVLTFNRPLQPQLLS